MVAYSLRSILCVPMLVRDQVTGVIYADNRIKTGLFGDRDRDMLAAFANQAALAIENARLFERVRQQLAAITVMRDLMDNVFESITSGVITTDMDDRVMMFNRAAETILGVPTQQVIEQSYLHTLPIAIDLQPWIDEVKLHHTIIARELERELPERGAVELSMNFAPLRGRRRSNGVGCGDCGGRPDREAAAGSRSALHQRDVYALCAAGSGGAAAARSVAVEVGRRAQTHLDFVRGYSRLHDVQRTTRAGRVGGSA